LYYVYILECSDGTLYTGWTVNIKERLKQHNRGKAAKYTRSRLPTKLRYLESVESKTAALQKEAAIKSLPRKAKLQLVATQSH
jgi:putative endonuclease